MFLRHENKSIQYLSYTSPKWKHELKSLHFTAKERESYHSTRLETAQSKGNLMQVGLRKNS